MWLFKRRRMNLNAILVFMCCCFSLVHHVSSASAPFKLQILHNNDMHARFEEADSYGGMCMGDQRNCFGGFARTKQAVDNAKEQARLAGYPSIFLNAGDTFQGTAYYTIYKWKIVAPLIDALGIDVMSLGNHEFDDGVDDLVQFLKHIKTPTVACNLNLTSEERLRLPILTPSYTLTIDNVTIGIIGYLTPRTAEVSNTGKLQIYDEIPYLRAEAQRLKRDGINIVIALGHSGFERDVEIAEAIPEISVIVGGHSHSLLYTPKGKPPSVDPIVAPYPYMVTSKSGKKTPVVQAFCRTKYLGKLIVTFDDNGDVITAEGNTILLNSTIKKDPAMQKLVSNWSAGINDELVKVKGNTRVFLARPNATGGQFESNLANLLTDAYVDYGVRNTAQKRNHSWTDAPIALIQYGGIRIEFDHRRNNGSITQGDILMLLPFRSDLEVARYRGSTIKDAFEQATIESNRNGDYCKSLFASGIRVVYDLSQTVGNRVKSISVLCKKCSIPQYYPLAMDQVYDVILSTYLANGGDKFLMFKNERLNITKLGITDTDAFTKYLEKTKIVYPALEGRISVERSGSSTAVVSLGVLIIVPISFIYANSCT